MPSRTLAASAALCGLITACSTSSAPDSTPLDIAVGDGPGVDLVFAGGPIHAPGDPEVVAVDDGVIVFVGALADLGDRAGAETQIVDLAGRALVPGFIDNHNHLGEGGEVTCELRADRSLNRQFGALTRCADHVPSGEWIIGYGGSLDIEGWARGGPIVREVMNDAFPDHPAIVMDQTSHAMFVNDLALRAAGIDASTPDPPGGVLMRDADGALTNILVDNAGDIVMELAVRTLPARDDAFRAGIELGLAEARQWGVTTVGDGRTYWQRGMLEAWLDAEADGILTARVSVRPWIYPEVERDTQLTYLEGVLQTDRRRLVIIDQVKMYSDGVPEYGTGRVIEPYAFTWFDDLPHGLNYIDRAAMAEWLVALDAIGFGAHIHAIGDLGVRETLDAIEDARDAGSARRYHMTHLSMVDPADVPRFAALDVDADLQLYATHDSHAHEGEDYADLMSATRIGALLFTPVAELHDSGANVVLSSDWTVQPMSPLLAISYAVQEGSLTLDEALDAYTVHAAQALEVDDITGRIAEGMAADLVVLSRDIFGASARQIRDTRVDMTVFAGAVVYER